MHAALQEFSKRKMTQDVKVLTVIGVLTIAILFGAVFFLSKSDKPPQKSPPVDINLLTKNAKHTILNNGAKVTITEFADFQCPACAIAYPSIKQILKDYGNRINYAYRFFPLPQHKNALIAIYAAESASEQGKFWEMHDILFEKQSEWGESTNPSEFFIKYASELQLDINKFSQSMSKNNFNDIIKTDTNDAISLGVSSTPTIYVNNVKFDLNPSYQNLMNEIDKELKL